jgi:hypothetical protein
LTIAGTDPTQQVMVTVFQNGEEGDTFPLTPDTYEFSVEPATYRLVFEAPDGYVADPSELEFTIACDESRSLHVDLKPETVPDTTPPVIASVTPSESSIWPPNGRMVDISLAVSATDDSGEAPACSIVSVSSNDGTSADWQFSPNSLSLSLRAKRSGHGARVYTITVECKDAAGNSATKTATVIAPHEQRR